MFDSCAAETITLWEWLSATLDGPLTPLSGSAYCFIDRRLSSECQSERRVQASLRTKDQPSTALRHACPEPSRGIERSVLVRSATSTQACPSIQARRTTAEPKPVGRQS